MKDDMPGKLVVSAAIKTVREIAAIVPDGIGSWPEAWEIVGDADTAYSKAVSAWAKDPGAKTGRAASDAHDVLLDAWREASDQFRARG